MSDHFDIGELPAGSVAWILGCEGYADMVTWAPTAAKARWNWVYFYRNAYGNNGQWPRVTAKRYELLDKSHLPHRFKRRVMELQEAMYA